MTPADSEDHAVPKPACPIALRYLDRPEAAAYLRISMRSLDRLRKRGELPDRRIGGRIVADFSRATRGSDIYHTP